MLSRVAEEKKKDRERERADARVFYEKQKQINKKKMEKKRAGKRTALEKEGSGGVDGGKKC